jgi:hypothetical protein
MLSELLIGLALMSLCVVMHATGVIAAVRWFRGSVAASRSFWLGTWLFVRLATWIVLLHLLEITTWAVVYDRNGAMPDLDSALYFSAVTYTTTGYGDLLLPHDWRLVGAIEAVTGILMCGWSTGFFFLVVSRVFRPADPSS